MWATKREYGPNKTKHVIVHWPITRAVSRRGSGGEAPQDIVFPPHTGGLRRLYNGQHSTLTDINSHNVKSQEARRMDSKKIVLLFMVFLVSVAVTFAQYFTTAPRWFDKLLLSNALAVQLWLNAFSHTTSELVLYHLLPPVISDQYFKFPLHPRQQYYIESDEEFDYS